MTTVLHGHRSSRVLVTGGAGFIGGHLCQRLVDSGHEVLVVDDLSTGARKNVPTGARLERLDVVAGDLHALMSRWRPGVVVHLAAQTSVPQSALDPVRDLQVNAVGTWRVAAAGLATGVSRILLMSSGGAVYGETRRQATEKTPPQPASYYGIHKLTAEGYVQVSGLSHAIIRPSNVYGPRQVAGVDGAVVASFLRQARTGSLRIDGDGRQTRDFVHVDDVVDALLLLLRVRASGTWNVSAGTSLSINELAALIDAAVGRRLGRVAGATRPGDVRRSAISSARLGALGWRPTIDLASGLRGLVQVAGSTDEVVPAP